MRAVSGFVIAVLLLGGLRPALAAQEDSSGTSDAMSLNLLTAPSAPAFVVLGIETTSVERPGSVTDVAVSLRSATDDFSALPENYAVSVTPYWLTSAADGLDYDTYVSGEGALLRTATISVATTTTVDETSGQQTTSLGLGLRMSLVQGPIAQDEAYLSRLDSLRAAMEVALVGLSQLHQAKLLNDPVLTALEEASDAATTAAERVTAEEGIAQRTQELAQEAEDELTQTHQDQIETIRRQAAGLPERRSGFNLDLAVGTAIDFLEADFNQGDLRNGGVWLTGSLEYPWGAALAVGRLLSDWTDDVTSFDLGGRFILDNVSGMSLSAEGLGRLFPNSDTRDTEWRVALAADYSIGSNRLLSFTFGRNFDGQRNSDLILALNLSLGFGALRPIY